MTINPLTESRIHQRSNHGTTSGCEVQLSNASSYQRPELIPDPLSNGGEVEIRRTART